MNRRTQTETEIEEMQPVAWRPDGTPTRFEIVQRDQAQPYVIGDDDAPIVSPLPVERLPRVQYVVTGSPIDEAVAFNRRVYSLALVVGLLVVTLAFVFGASLSFWLAAFLWDTMRSPGGIELVNVLSLWQFLRAEQRHRHGRYSAPPSERVQMIRLIVGAAAVGATVLFLALIVAGVALEQMPR
jgi:hypothetical protein